MRWRLTYGDFGEDTLQEYLIFSESLQQFELAGDVDEDREGILGDRLESASVMK